MRVSHLALRILGGRLMNWITSRTRRVVYQPPHLLPARHCYPIKSQLPQDLFVHTAWMVHIYSKLKAIWLVAASFWQSSSFLHVRRYICICDIACSSRVLYGRAFGTCNEWQNKVAPLEQKWHSSYENLILNYVVLVPELRVARYPFLAISDCQRQNLRLKTIEKST